MTYEEVLEAYQQLAAAGEYPSREKVRERLGYGSERDISLHLKRIRETQEPTCAYPLPQPDQDTVRRRLADLEGERQAMALQAHLREFIAAGRMVPLVGEGGVNWLFRSLSAMGEIATLGLSIRGFSEDLSRVLETGQHLLSRVERQYQRLKTQDHQEVQEDGATTATEPR
jgi:hypothetical protein